MPPLHDGGEVSVGLLATAHGSAVPDGAVVVTQRPLLEGGVQARAADRALAQLLTAHCATEPLSVSATELRLRGGSGS